MLVPRAISKYTVQELLVGKWISTALLGTLPWHLGIPVKSVLCCRLSRFAKRLNELKEAGHELALKYFQAGAPKQASSLRNLVTSESQSWRMELLRFIKNTFNSLVYSTVASRSQYPKLQSQKFWLML